MSTALVLAQLILEPARLWVLTLSPLSVKSGQPYCDPILIAYCGEFESFFFFFDVPLAGGVFFSATALRRFAAFVTLVTP